MLWALDQPDIQQKLGISARKRGVTPEEMKSFADITLAFYTKKKIVSEWPRWPAFTASLAREMAAEAVEAESLIPSNLMSWKPRKDDILALNPSAQKQLADELERILTSGKSINQLSSSHDGLGLLNISKKLGSPSIYPAEVRVLSNIYPLAKKHKKATLKRIYLIAKKADKYLASGPFGKRFKSIMHVAEAFSNVQSLKKLRMKALEEWSKWGLKEITRTIYSVKLTKKELEFVLPIPDKHRSSAKQKKYVNSIMKEVEKNFPTGMLKSLKSFDSPYGDPEVTIVAKLNV